MEIKAIVISIFVAILVACCTDIVYHTSSQTNNTNDTTLLLNNTTVFDQNTTTLCNNTTVEATPAPPKNSKSVSCENIDDEYERLVCWVKSAPYNTTDYKAGVFDCSNMAALLHDWLEDHGYDIKIVLGYSYNHAHTWLLAGKLTGMVVSQHYRHYKVDGYWIEPTSKKVMPELPDFYYERYKHIGFYDDYSELCMYRPVPCSEYAYNKTW